MLSGLESVRLVVVGDGPLRSRLERLLPEALFLGWQVGPALAAGMASFDIGVHPGEHETFGQAAQEKLASGVPVVAVAAGGILDLVRERDNGYLYPPGRLGDSASGSAGWPPSLCSGSGWGWRPGRRCRTAFGTGSVIC